MATPAYAGSSVLFGGKVGSSWTRAGDIILVAFLLVQCFDGVFTYVGVASFGPDIEANPLLASLMATLGHGTALTLAKVMAMGLGIALHLNRVHGAVAVLTAFYVGVAIVPWTMILF